MSTATTPPHLAGNLAPVPDEVTITGLEVTGSIPPELTGWYLRNGPVRHVTDGETVPLDDATLTRAAQEGEVTALGLLLERHRAGMRAVALSVLGPAADVDDVMQDAALTALRRIGDVREPAAVGAWLRMIVRNAGRSVLRESVVLRPMEELPVTSTDLGPEQWLEQNAVRDWVWQALEELSPVLRMPLVLRHFATGVTSYEEIAHACGVPVGTVRSRLSQGRVKLAAALAATADAPHGDAAQRVRASRNEAVRMLAAARERSLRQSTHRSSAARSRPPQGERSGRTAYR
ncbi:sigma-70 family RNA polymerase sigma factor [Streptomyces sp. NPDC088387]|uniref:RNA polymerase sigma factor n=1 Tax=Streptomyces sp. NPDC088387 TaxID=3365859 RepID=UPI0037F900E7